MTLTRKRLPLAVAVLYAARWVGGAIVYRGDMTVRAREEYAKALELQGRLDSAGGTRRPIVHANGPSTSLNWCVPLMPGLLFVSSDYYIGPLWGHGGLRLVLFYGIGTLESPALGWRA